MMILSEMAETDSLGHGETNGDIMEWIRRRRGGRVRPSLLEFSFLSGGGKEGFRHFSINSTALLFKFLNFE